MLVALSCLLVLLSATVVWAHRTVLNTSAFVGTVAPVFKNPAVASGVAARGAGELAPYSRSICGEPCLPLQFAEPSVS